MSGIWDLAELGLSRRVQPAELWRRSSRRAASRWTGRNAGNTGFASFSTARLGHASGLHRSRSSGTLRASHVLTAGRRHPVNRVTTRLRGKLTTCMASNPKKPDATRVARPDSWRLHGVIASHRVGRREAVIPWFYPIGRPAIDAGRQGRTSLGMWTPFGVYSLREAVLLKVGDDGLAVEIPHGGSDQSSLTCEHLG